MQTVVQAVLYDVFIWGPRPLPIVQAKGDVTWPYN